MEDEFSKEIKMGFIFLKDVIDISVYVIKGFIFPSHYNYITDIPLAQKFI